ncbi:uncharacterized protein BKA78DRAFT_116848 [Phyllosticta capitalensis]|uniref:uncharacterized protein n=1 Tax=Phyllosticta capitalensis TaxID=121624 RepID=UPI00312FBDDB
MEAKKRALAKQKQESKRWVMAGHHGTNNCSRCDRAKDSTATQSHRRGRQSRQGASPNHVPCQGQPVLVRQVVGVRYMRPSRWSSIAGTVFTTSGPVGIRLPIRWQAEPNHCQQQPSVQVDPVRQPSATAAWPVARKLTTCLLAGLPMDEGVPTDDGSTRARRFSEDSGGLLLYNHGKRVSRTIDRPTPSTKSKRGHV